MKRLALALTFFLASLAGFAQAQDAPTLSSLEIALWPEFDRPEVLVIYRGLFAADTPLPAAVELRIPASAGEPAAVAYVDESGQRFNQAYTTRSEGDWLVVSFELETLGFQLEYYDSLPVDSSGQRAYTYAYTADYDITALSLEFQVPPTAEAFVLEPAADSVSTQGDGLTYHQVSAGSLAQGETRSWALTYQKDNAGLTISAFEQPTAPAPVAPPAAQGGDNTTLLVFLVAFVALIGVGAGAFWLGRHTQPELADTTPPQRAKRRGSGRGAELRTRRTEPDETLFCHKCGAELRSDSEFCHKCGAAIRKL